MRGILIIFNNEETHTGYDLDLVQEEKKIEKPEVQTYTVKVPGRNGLLNLTKGLTGKVTYYNRALSFQYFGAGSRSRLLELDDEFSKYHGQTIRIVDDDHPEHYYEGEATVDTEIHGNYITIVLEVDAQPFRLKRELTRVSQEIAGAATVRLVNESIEAIPVITVTAETSITYGETTITLNAGTHTVDALTLRAGVNVFEVSGTGTITIEYQEGAI